MQQQRTRKIHHEYFEVQSVRTITVHLTKPYLPTLNGQSAGHQTPE